MKIEEIMEIVLKSGKIFLESGAEIYRVEYTLNKIFEAYNIRGEYFVISTGIFITLYESNNQSLTRFVGIKGISTDVHRLELINNFSRDLQENPMNYEDSMATLSKIENIPVYPFYIQLLCAAGMSFSFTFFFDGTVYEAAVAGIIAAMIFSLQTKLLSKYFFTFFNYFVASLLGGIICTIVSKVFPSLNLIKIIIGTIMILLPGSSITNAMKDALNGDVVSSSYKFSETIFIATAISAGIAITLSFVLRW